MLVIALLVSLEKGWQPPPFDGTLNPVLSTVEIPGLAGHASSTERSCPRAAGAITKSDSAAAAGTRHENPSFICILRFSTSLSLMGNYRPKCQSVKLPRNSRVPQRDITVLFTKEHKRMRVFAWALLM